VLAFLKQDSTVVLGEATIAAPPDYNACPYHASLQNMLKICKNKKSRIAMSQPRPQSARARDLREIGQAHGPLAHIAHKSPHLK
jgi:hypothetical protein